MSPRPAPNRTGTSRQTAAPGAAAVAAVSAGVYALVGGAVTLVGWALNQPWLTDWNGDGISMFPNTAVGAMLGGGALLLLARSGHSMHRTVAARLAAGLMALIGGLTLLQHLYGWNFGIDTLLVDLDRPWGQRAATAPMRMGPPASSSFLILGAGLLLATVGPRARRLAATLSILPIAIASLSLTGYWFGAGHLFGIALTGIAFQTSTILVALGIGLMAVVPEHGLLSMLQRNDAGAVIVRRLTLPIVVIPLVLGRLRILGEEAGLYDAAFGISLLVLTTIAMLLALLWWTARGISEQAQIASAAERALRNSEERYRAVVESQAEMVCRFRPGGSILFVNPAYARARGKTPDELVGRNFWDFIAEEDRPAVRSMLERLTPESPEIHIENRFESTKGIHWTLWTNRALAFDAGGQLIEAQSTGIDISDRKRAEEMVRALLRISERLNSTLDVDELLDILVQEAIELVGAESGVSGLHTPEGLASKKYFQNGQELPLEYCWPPMHGLPGWLLVHKTPYATNDAGSDPQIVRELCERFGVRSALSTPIITAQGEVIGFFEIHNKKSGSGFTSSDREMLLSVSQTAAIAVQNAIAYRSLQRAEESLKQADRRKDEFLATLAHELRNPLAPIRNVLEIMKHASSGDDLLPNARQMMERQLAHLVRLVDDLLDVSRITRDKLELRKGRVELASVVYQAIEASRPLVDELQHELTLSLPPDPIYLDADSVRLAQVFNNLINNACKYTERQGRVRVSAEREGSDVVVKVKDSGVGIAPEMVPKVFEMFAQVHGMSEQSQGGLGIGLTLVKRLVEMHGGSIQAQSDGPGHGSEFVVRLPILIEPPNTVDTQPAAAKMLSKGHRVLVVDDNRDTASSLAMLLNLTGNETSTAHDGLEALEAAEKFRPDVVLLDIGLPNMNGYEVCRRIRGQPWGKGLIMLAITGWGQEEDRRRSKEAGFDGHLIKPVDLAKLEEILADLPTTAPEPPEYQIGVVGNGGGEQ